MSFLKDLSQNLGQTMTNVAETVVERSQNLTSQAQLQLSLKKLQLDRTRRLNDLGRRTYAWYQSGSLVVSGTVPSEVSDICRQIDSLSQEVEKTQHLLEEARAQAQSSDADSPAGEPDAAPPASTSLVTLPPSGTPGSGTSAASGGPGGGSTPPYTG